MDAVQLDDLENDDITEEETKRAEVDAASCNPKLPKHMATCMGRLEPARLNRTENFVRFQGSSRTFGWIFAKMRHFVSHLKPGRGPFPSKFPNFGLQNVPTRTFFRLNIKRKQQRLFKYWEKER